MWNHTWSLAVEEHFYILLPLLLLLLLGLNGPSADPFTAFPWIALATATACLALRIWLAREVPFDNLVHLFPTHLRIDSLLLARTPIIIIANCWPA